MNDMNLMKETLESADLYITQVIEGIESITSNIQKGREDKALTMCIDLVDGLNWLIEAMDLTLLLQEAHGQPINIDFIGNLLSQLAEALENKDYVLLGDLLEYELVPLLSGVQDQIQQLLLKIGS